MLSCTNISYIIDQQKILNKLSFKLKQGEHLLILGESGSGKTTLLAMLAGLLTPNSGEIIYDDKKLYQLNNKERDKFRGKNIGIIFQNFHLIQSLSICENLEVAAQMSGQKIEQQQINNYLKELGLAGKGKYKPNELSVGQAQRVAVLRSFVSKPKWLLCDEPTSALDAANTKKLLDLLKKEAKKQQASIIIATHDLRVKDYFKNDKILEL